ncbi:MAG TPA: DUF748 domain-containing protein [Polyangia bacterium]|nr:DUF748 domain-containing protein [Polyangia bacterium]
MADEHHSPPAHRRRWPRRLAIAGGVTIALVAILGFFVVPPIARSQAEKQLSQLLGRKVSVARVRVNPFALSLAVEGLQIYEPDGTTPFVGFSRLYVNAQISSVFRRAPVVKEIALEALRVHVVRTKATAQSWGDVDAAYNFSDILARLAAMPKSSEPPEPPSPEPPRFSLNNIHIDDAAIVFDDKPTGDHHEVTGLSVGVPFASTLPVYLDSFVEPGLRVSIDGTPFAIQGRTKPFKESLETVLELRLQALDLTRYVPFVPLRLPFAVRSAKLSLALDVAFVRTADDAPKLTVKGDVALDALDVEHKREHGTAPLLELEKLAITLGESDLTAQNVHVEKVLVSGLDVHVHKLEDGSLDVEHLAPTAPPESAAQRREERQEKKAEKEKEREEEKVARAHDKKKTDAEGPRFAVDSFVLERTTLHFRDESVTPAFETEVRDVAVDVRGLSNARGATAKVELGLRAVPGGVVRDRGTLRLTPLAAEGKLTIDDVEPGRFAPYTHDLVAFDVGSGRARLGADYVFEAPERGAPEVKLRDAFFELTDLALHRRGAKDDFFKLASFAVHGAKLDLGARKVEVAEIATHDAKVRAARDAKGVVDLTTLVPPAKPAATTKPLPATSAEPAAPAPDWTVTIGRFDLDRWGARFEDHAVAAPAVLTVDPIALHLTNVSTAPGAKLGVDLRLGINKTGKLQVTGTATLPPVAANLRFDLRGLEILPFQPYFQDQESLLVTGGTIALRGQANVKTSANGDPKLDVTTDVDVADVSTVDRAQNEPLLAWKSFHVGALHVASPPMAVAISDVSLTDFTARLVMFPDAHFNLQEAFAAPGAPPPPPKKKPEATKTAAASPEEPPPPVTIGQVTLQGGKVTFTDRSIHPSYSADLTELAGRVSGLSSTPGTTANVDIRGSVNRSGVLTIVGNANPLAKDLALDVQVNLRDFELPPASPYSGHYAGYVISKGKLDLSLAYKIAAGKLDAQNKLVLDQFTFGDKVDSPDATKLPVRLAVALLKDRRGVIDIDLPIAGSLADPEFKIWHAVLKVLGNLVVKAVTAPFSLIASAFGGGEELSHVEFPAGRATLDATAQKRLGALAKALRERPGISFEIQGGADPKQDREGLRRFLYERKLKAVKLAALVQTGAAVPSLDELTLTDAERPALVAAAYEAEKFPKPTNAIGLEKSLPPEEQEKLMLVNTRVEDDELRALALRRATAVQASLAKSVPGAASRLFLVTPRLTAGNVELDLKKD